MSKPATDTQLVDHRYDRVLLAVTFALIALGIVMVYSASAVAAETQTGDPTFFVRRQITYLLPGLLLMVLGGSVHHELWGRLATPILVISVALLVLVLVPGVASTAKGASRWIDIKFFRVQPSEVVKVGLILFLARMLSRDQARIDAWQVAWVRPLAVVGVVAALLMAQPDFGSTVICGGITILMVWTAGASHAQTGLLFGSGAALAGVAVLMEPYRLKRLLAFLSPEDDPQGTAYQINQALISFGSGHVTGLGLGESRQKLLYLPDAHTDFIFAIIGEELGLVGAALVMILFGIFVWRGLRIARRAASSFGALLAFGLTAAIGFQAAVNMAVVTALLPTKGLTLPFISYGGSSMLMLCASVGMLLNISRRQPPPSWLHRREMKARANDTILMPAIGGEAFRS